MIVATAPLELGAIDGDHLVCPWHGWRYDLSDGSCPASQSALPVFEVAEDEGTIRARIGAPG
jgi:nitrite reductase/ring-hydroxylating ferredoxin subunit